MGQDPLTGINYDHRKDIFLNHIRHLARFFSIDVMGYAVMSNHFHLVIRYDPSQPANWDDEEVARRWCSVFNGLPLEQRLDGPEHIEDFGLSQLLRYHELLADSNRVQRCRNVLGSLSRFMQHLKQPFAVWANHEDDCKGHFFESRFYSGVLLEQEDLLACMAYVDLNPVEAGMARSLRQARHTSIHERLYEERFNRTELEDYLAPLWAETDDNTTPITCTLAAYVNQLNLAVISIAQPIFSPLDKAEIWMAKLLNRERSKAQQPPEFFDYA